MPQPEADSETVSNKDDSPPSSNDGTSRAKSPYGRERLVLGISLVSVIVLFSLTGTIQVYRATLGAPATATRFRTCEDGVRSLYAGFSRKLSAIDLESEAIAPRRPTTDPVVRADLRTLDEALRALEPLCVSEGPEGREAWAGLERWRHRTEDNARLLEQNVTPDAERALRYHSPTRR